MQHRCFSIGLLTLAVLAFAAPAHAERKPPYYASLKASKARMRSGPGRNYPTSWFYQRRGLPLKVVASYGAWLKVRDPDGAEGWMQANLLEDKRTGIVRGGVAELRRTPAGDSHISWRAAPGVVGRISACNAGWCWFDVAGRAGYVEQARLWGTDPGEAVR
ncbi:SH3 domain-containing protein [Sphingomonas sp. HT-1]|uniref:SH3 domain-containing protein n=1 Tax=unclassified Sphingomonas TaxID=196159 RepID=UPI0002F2A74E|nr:SH3 domain-containing protein [Sphingomonas sp. WG]KTF69163.1 hypothetical protein ATB93_09870 [Sphingomonas sp. WG]